MRSDAPVVNDEAFWLNERSKAKASGLTNYVSGGRPHNRAQPALWAGHEAGGACGAPDLARVRDGQPEPSTTDYWLKVLPGGELILEQT